MALVAAGAAIQLPLIANAGVAEAYRIIHLTWSRKHRGAAQVVPRLALVNIGVVSITGIQALRWQQTGPCLLTCGPQCTNDMAPLAITPTTKAVPMGTIARDHLNLSPRMVQEVATDNPLIGIQVCLHQVQILG